jgi:hypothetical protein
MVLSHFDSRSCSWAGRVLPFCTRDSLPEPDVNRAMGRVREPEFGERVTSGNVNITPQRGCARNSVSPVPTYMGADERNV